MNINIATTTVFQKNWDAYHKSSDKFIINQGGTRSSKSISILQCLIGIAMEKPQVIDIVRKWGSSMSNSIARDFYNLLKEYGIYDDAYHNKSNNSYTFPNGSIVEFLGASDGQRLRGRKRDVLYVNEANELDLDEWLQLLMRLTGKAFLDFNPSDVEHWIYDLIKEDKATLIKSTYTDNPFLNESEVENIESLIRIDDNYYKVFVLGEKPIAHSRIYTHFKQYSNLPNPNDITAVSYGLDFGYVHPSAMVKVYHTKDSLYVEELIYESKLTIDELTNKCKDLIDDKNAFVYCDSARPEIIESLKRLGVRAKSSDKNVQPGLDSIRKKMVFININSVNLWREFKLYSYKVDRNEKVTEEIIKLNDDLLDAMRYAVHSHKPDSNYSYSMMRKTSKK
jgi:phage terminase large subunit